MLEVGADRWMHACKIAFETHNFTRLPAITMARRACLALLGLSCLLPSSLGFPAWLKCNRLLEEDEVSN